MSTLLMIFLMSIDYVNVPNPFITATAFLVLDFITTALASKT